MGLVSMLPSIDTRSRFRGHQVDYIFVRALDVVHAEAPEVGSSDHNPVLATLRVVDASRAGTRGSGFAPSSSPDQVRRRDRSPRSENGRAQALAQLFQRIASSN